MCLLSSGVILYYFYNNIKIVKLFYIKLKVIVTNLYHDKIKGSIDDIEILDKHFT